MAGAFLADVTANIVAAGHQASIQGYIAFAPSGTEGLFEGIAAPGSNYVLADGSSTFPAGVEGFGRSLLHAAQALFDQQYASVCLLNADSPTLPTSFLARAAGILALPGDRIVLGPARDGGYYLIGMKAPHACLFQEVAWSTGSVAEQTRIRARDHGLDVVELPVWYDVDDAASLELLLAELANVRASGPQNVGPFPAPATMRCIAALGLGPN